MYNLVTMMDEMILHDKICRDRENVMIIVIITSSEKNLVSHRRYVWPKTSISKQENRIIQDILTHEDSCD